MTDGIKVAAVEQQNARDRTVSCADAFGIPGLAERLGTTEQKAKEFARAHLTACHYTEGEPRFTAEALREVIEGLSVDPAARSLVA